MWRTLLGCVVLVGLSGAGRAGEAEAASETLIRLEVPPAPAPRPALRYQLLPELAELSPGNPIQGYLVCSMERRAFFFDKAACDRREELLAMPLKELPARDLLEYGKSALEQADRAARLDRPDWQILTKLRSEGFFLLLPDVQEIRAPARALVVRLRSEIALGRFDDAIRTLKTLFAMARHLGEHPTIIGNLVGIAIANMALAPIDEMLPQPGCPNFYWALTNLPSPMVPMSQGMSGERVMGLWLYRGLDDRAPMGADRIERFVADMDTWLADEAAFKAVGGVRGWLGAQVRDRAKVDAARGRLVAHGLSEDRVLKFPAEQAILLDEKREYEVRRDDDMKTATLPIWQAEAMVARLKAGRKPALFADALLPFLTAVRRAEGRLEQRIGLLRHVEALRLHAAEHDGRLPASLSEAAVPLPVDPFTGRPFRYEVKGATAHLRGSPPSGEEKTAPYNIHYEINIRK